MRITLYDKDRSFIGQEGAPLVCKVTPRVFPLIGTATVVVPLASPQAAKFATEGTRVVFEENGEHLLSGPVDSTVLDTETDTLEVIVLDDAWVLHKILGWQSPASAITSQEAVEYRSYTGPAETVIKQVVQQNGVDRLKIPGLTVAPNQARGTVIDGGTTYRMHPIPDRIYPGLTIAGLGVQIKQVGTQLVFDVYVPRVYPTVLSVEGRTLKKAVHTRKRPQASRAVIAGPGEGTLRRFRQVTDTAREATWGFLGETYRDARDVQQAEGVSTWTEVDATLDARGREALVDAGPVDGLSVVLAESSIFTYGAGGIRVGDLVPVRMRSVVITDTVNEATIEWITPTYSRATPAIGEQTDAETRRAKTLAALKESQRKEERA